MSKMCRIATKVADSKKIGAFEAGLRGADGEILLRDGLLSPTLR